MIAENEEYVCVGCERVVMLRDVSKSLWYEWYEKEKVGLWAEFFSYRRQGWEKEAFRKSQNQPAFTSEFREPPGNHCQNESGY
jgi:hypothetical protein